MNAETFISAIKACVHDSAVYDVIESVKQPSGRKPAASELHLSDWYNALEESDKANVRAMVLHGVHSALFGFFAVLDGDRVIEDTPEKSDFLIIRRRDGTDEVISDPTNPFHDLYQAEVWDELFGEIRQP